MICFHHNDLDGRCAGAVVKLWHDGAKNPGERTEFVELDYKDTVPLGKVAPGELTVIVDLSFKPDITEQLLTVTPQVIWIDHHKVILDAPEFMRKLRGIRSRDFSGCELAWQFFFPGITPPPQAVQLIGDMDAWKWKLDATEQFCLGLMKLSHKPTDQIWKELLRRPLSDEAEALMSKIVSDGRICQGFRDAICRDYAASFGFETEFEGHRAFACGFYEFGSKFFQEKMDQYPICLSFEFDGEKWAVGLYSKTLDVGEIAKRHGGGGHTGSAGFVADSLELRKVAGGGK